MNRNLSSFAFAVAVSSIACEHPEVLDERGGRSGPVQPGTPPARGPGSSTFIPLPPLVDGTSPTAGKPSEKVCGLESYTLERTPADVLLVFDRSRSMRDKAPGSAADKWTETTTAVDHVLMRTNETISWGLKMFPAGATSHCAMEAGVDVPIGPRRYSDMVSAIQAKTTGGPNGHGTPTRVALTDAVAYLRERKSTNAQFIVLATDGEPTCMDGRSAALPDTKGAVDAVKAAQEAGFPVFVIGVATTGSAAHASLNMMAEQGGRARAGDTKYYAASTHQELSDAFTQITGQLASCTFKLGKVPPSPKDVAVNIGDVRVSQDERRMDGWDYNDDRSAIDLYGPACENLKAAVTVKVGIIFGCPNIVIP